jgi:osmotically-inducible protein OsmY
MTTGNVVNNLFIKDKNMAPDTDTADFKIKIEILLKLAVIPDVKILAPNVFVKNGTVTLGGIVDAYWKREYIANIVSSELPGRPVENNLTVAMACFLDYSSPAVHEKELKRPRIREKNDHHYIVGDVL